MSRWRLLRAWHRCFVLFFFFFSSHFHRFVTMRPCDPRPWIISILRRINGWRDEKNRWIHEIIGQWIWISVEGGGKSGFWRFTFSFFFVGIRFIYRFEFLAKSGNRSLHEFEWNKRKSAPFSSSLRWSIENWLIIFSYSNNNGEEKKKLLISTARKVFKMIFHEFFYFYFTIRLNKQNGSCRRRNANGLLFWPIKI